MYFTTTSSGGVGASLFATHDIALRDSSSGAGLVQVFTSPSNAVRCDTAGATFGQAQACVVLEGLPVLDLPSDDPLVRQNAAHVYDALYRPRFTSPAGSGAGLPGRVEGPYLTRSGAVVNAKNRTVMKRICGRTYGEYASNNAEDPRNGGSTNECDEFPPAASNEGGANGTTKWSARVIDSDDNGKAGGRLGVMFKVQRVAVDEPYAFSVSGPTPAVPLAPTLDPARTRTAAGALRVSGSSHPFAANTLRVRSSGTTVFKPMATAKADAAGTFSLTWTPGGDVKYYVTNEGGASPRRFSRLGPSFTPTGGRYYARGSQVSISGQGAPETVVKLWLRSGDSMFLDPTAPYTRTELRPVDSSGAWSYSLVMDSPYNLYAEGSDGRTSVKTQYNLQSSAPDQLISLPAPTATAEPVVTVNFSDPGKVGAFAYLTFTGASGQRGATRWYDKSIGSNDIYLVSPTGVILGSRFDSSGNYPSFLDTITLPEPGVYTLRINPTYGGTVRHGTLQLEDVAADDTRDVVADGTPTRVVIVDHGQNANLRFEASAGDRISTQMTGSSIMNTSFGTTFRMTGPTGGVVAIGYTRTSSGFLGPVTITASGEYTVVLDPMDDIVDNASVRVLQTPDDASGDVALGGPAIQTKLTTPGPNANYAFSGTAGQRVSVRVSDNTMAPVTIDLVGPTGSTLTSLTSSATVFALTTPSLPSSGRYALRVNPAGDATGSATLQLTAV